MGIEKCQQCSEPFKVWEHKLAMPGTKEKEAIICPHCGFTIERYPPEQLHVFIYRSSSVTIGLAA